MKSSICIEIKFKNKVLIKIRIAEKPIYQKRHKNDCYSSQKLRHFVFVFERVAYHIFHNSFIIMPCPTLLLLKTMYRLFLLSQNNITNDAIFSS